MANTQIAAHERRVQRRKDIEKRPRRRYILPNTWVFISSRTRDGQLLFSEFDELDSRRVKGLYAVAAKRYGVQLAIQVLMGNHLHCMMRARRGKRISLAMQYVKAGIARLVKRKHGTEGPVWAGPFHHQHCLDAEAEQARFRYILSHGSKEGFVVDPADWDLPHCVDALTGDGRLRGVAYDRAAGAWRPVSVQLTPLTGWMKGPWSDWREQVRRVVAEIVAEQVEARAVAGESPGSGGARGEGPPVRRRRDHRFVPDDLKHSYNRIFLALGPGAKGRVRDAYAERRLGIDAALAAAEVLVLDGGGMGVGLPEACQWPAFPAEAMGDETWASMSFADVFQGVEAAAPA